jgi:uncharacterized phage protein (TIGR01671 family)
MREILFRGQTRKKGQKVWVDGTPVDGEWVYGGVLQGVGDFSVIYGGKNQNDYGEDLQKWCVYTDTLGQFTGLTDKNGKKIFEGDIVQYSNPDEDIIHGTVAYGNHSCCGTHEVGFFVEWQKPEFAMCLREDIGFWTNFREIEVIGNIHDNPELLGGAEDG